MKYVEASRKLFLETGIRFQREIIWAIGLLKYASAKANVSLGLIDKRIGETIAKHALSLSEGRYDDRIMVDVFQTGSGTGLNMNVNELIAELSSSELGINVHPNDHVNMCQSSNDVGPSTIRIAAVSVARKDVINSIKKTINSIKMLSSRTSTVYKSGRTHLRDALPVTMGQEFSAYAFALEREMKELQEITESVCMLPIGGTAVGTGLNSDEKFGAIVVDELTRVSGIKFSQSRNKFAQMKLMTDLLGMSSVYKAIATDTFRMCQDIRLMFSGPITGLNEIDIPTQEEIAGSSIMPGKTNPVTVESSLLACSQVIGLDSSNQIASLLGEFELSMGVPLLGYNIVMQGKLLASALSKLSEHVIDGIVPNKEVCMRYAESSPSLITIISPVIGYDKASELGKKIAKGVSIRQALKDLGYDDQYINKILDMSKLVKPGFPARPRKKS